MDRDRQRILGLLVAFVVLLVASVFVMDWFVADMAVAKISIDLRSITMCAAANPCASVSLGDIKGGNFYTMLAPMTFWGSIVVAIIVIYQAGTRILSGYANASLTRIGMLGGVSMIGATVFAGYIFAPEGSNRDLMMIERTTAPLLLVVGHIAGALALYFSAHQLVDDDVGEYKPLTPARALESTPSPAVTALVPAAAAAEISTPTTSRPLPVFPEHLRKQLRFVVLGAEVTRGGVDARREDGSTVLVMWRDVVGVVARRLPAEHDGATFVDLVSVAGRTLRILPWTRLTGDPIAVADPGDDAARARAFVALVGERAPDAKLDPATSAFVTGDQPAAQLPDVATLARHDDKLA